MGCFAFTAGGDFHPALRTSAARYGQPDGNYDQWPARQQAPSHRKSACPHAARARLQAPKRAIKAAQPDSRPANSARPDSHAANPIPVCSHINNYGARRAVDEPRFACGWTPGAVARIPQITSLDPRRPRAKGIAARSDASDQRVSACCVRINHRI